MSPDRDGLLAPEAVARLLRVRPHTLANWRALGKGPAYVKFGRTVRYRESDIARWIHAHYQDGDRVVAPEIDQLREALGDALGGLEPPGRRGPEGR